MTVLAPDRDRLAASSDEVKRTVEIVWSAYRSVLSKEGGLAYVSMAITSGVRMLDVLEELGLATADDLKTHAPAAFYERVIRPNIEAGGRLARTIAGKVDHPVVAPSIFDAKRQRWGQDEYMALWLRMIEENVRWIYMAPGWEFSNGGVEEFLHAVQMSLGFRGRSDIEILDHDGKPLTIHAGMEAISRALLSVRDRKRKAPIVADAFRGLYSVWEVWHVHDVRRDELPENPNRAFLESGDNWRVGRAYKEVEGLLVEDYGFPTYRSVDTGTGVPRKNDATPEGIILKAEDPT